MNKQEDSRFVASTSADDRKRDTGNEAAREDEQDDAAEPDAPTGVEENAGMNTILGSGSGTGVQTDANDE